MIDFSFIKNLLGKEEPLHFKLYLKRRDIRLLPKKAHLTDAAFDLCADLEESIILKPFQQLIVPTGVVIETPKGYFIDVRPRSGLAAKHNITITNSPGTIDSGYLGEIKVILFNAHKKESYTVNPYDRIAQLVFHKVLPVNLEFTGIDAQTILENNNLVVASRGANGLGSTGK